MSGFNASIFNIPLSGDTPQNGYEQQVNVLPLNIIALIISHLDNVADLARICRTSRRFYYMTLPTLYSRMTLTSYDTIRYIDNQAEGCGSASPFSMGLNALVTRNVSNLVHCLTLQGDWREHDLKEYSQVGRVPDDAMMLNIAVRAAIDRCKQLESFKWDLTTKLLSPVYLGLAVLPRLESFHLRCPSSRSPRPTMEIPPMPNLRHFTVTQYDPLCYPDDISNLMLRATKLESLQLHFSPRMRDAGEPSVHLMHLFRKNIAARRPLRLKTMGIYNLFAMHDGEDLLKAFDPSCVRNVTFLNSFGADEVEHQPPATTQSGFLTFLDKSWAKPPKEVVNIVSQRNDRLNRKQALELASRRGMERLYLVNARHSPHVSANGTTTNPSPSTTDLLTPTNDSEPSGSRYGPVKASLTLRDMYLEAIYTFENLQHLIFPARWPLPVILVARLFRSCPNLSQLALALDCSRFEGLRMLVPFLHKLWAIRILIPESSDDGKVFVDLADEIHEDIMGKELANMSDFPVLRYVGLGWKIWQVGGIYELSMTVDGTEENAETVKMRRLKRIGPEEVKDVEIWKMDSLDVCEMY